VRDERFSRQSFLGEAGQAAIDRCVVGVAGLGGGGGHIVQQLAHVGFLNYVLYDGDVADESNLNRLVIATEADAANGTPKVEAARGRILAVRASARIEAFQCRWQDRPGPLRTCDLVFGCVDSFAERRELEAGCRRFLIPYIDVGMDLHQADDEPPVMGGQVFLSLPGGPCMFCLGFLTEEKLGREAARYGDAGGRPQVVWPNGVLASTAVGVAVDLLTDWSRSLRGPVYLSYRGNDGTVKPHPRLIHFQGGECVHYPPDQAGDPVFKEL
jgi:molybdopterin-synthase adenylyltransferase